MKRLFFVFALVLFTQVWSLASNPLSSSLPNIPAERGTATVNELANVVFTAVQANDFEQLPLYVPTDTELATLKKQASEDMLAVLEGLTSEAITSSLKESFETVIREGISKTLNLTELTLADVRTGTNSAKNKAMIPVTATLSTRTNQSFPLRFEALKINGRYFLFQRMAWQSAN
ncbi:hypothetical protein AHMF7605_00575 [Adhaeribacter arboris]|uniref:DUF3887 domain-containing protein n=1 Tax=Adhaeribacter arboris TaxID=2072846 RepID=A0A2T2Y9C6_9BACT|nr:hypothetical protein [Adhaeribacter arboris]PSR52120.1 hypothetical protein AHMF7605_00575 [Adhaeribacter arboris]